MCNLALQAAFGQQGAGLARVVVGIQVHGDLLGQRVEALFAPVNRGRAGAITPHGVVVMHPSTARCCPEAVLLPSESEPSNPRAYDSASKVIGDW